MHVITKIANIECTIPNNFQKKGIFHAVQHKNNV